MAEKKKIKIPKSVLQLKWSPKKFAKKHNIRIKGKGIKKGDRKRATKRLLGEYSEFAIVNLNKAVRILSENPMNDKKIEKITLAVDNIISNGKVMKEISKKYKKDPSRYPDLIYLPHMISNTITYYSREDLSDEDRAISERMDKEALIRFCESILKREIKQYRKSGLSSWVAFQLADVIPTAKRLKNNRYWYRKLIQQLYTIAEQEEIDMRAIFTAILKIDKKKVMKKSELYNGFYSEFILTKASNKTHTFNDTQKELHETLIENTLAYLDGLKGRRLHAILKEYIKRRKAAERDKNDTKRVIRFIDHANSNSSYTNIKAAVQELIADNSNNELYLS